MAMLWYTGFDINQILKLNIPVYLFVAWGILALTEYLLQVIRFRELLPPQKREDLKELAINYILGHFAAFISPSRSLGEGMRLLVFHKELGISLGRTSSIVITERLSDLLILSIALLGIFFYISPILGIIFMIGIILGFTLISSRRFSNIVLKIIPYKNIQNIAKEYFDHSREIIRSPKRFARILGIALLVWTVDFIRYWWILKTLGINVSFPVTAGTGALSYFSSIISIFPGGTVFFEGTGTAVYSYLGFESNLVLAGILIERIYSYWIWLITGAILATRHKLPKTFVQDRTGMGS